MIHSAIRRLFVLCLLVLPIAAVSTVAAATGTSEPPATLKTIATPYLRTNQALHHLRMDPKGRFLAFGGDDGQNLWLADLKSQDIFQVSHGYVGGAFAWAPDGIRLFFREQVRQADGSVASILSAYDSALSRSVTLERIKGPTSYLTFDPRDLRLQLLSPGGIHSKRIYFPDERLARWQVGQRAEEGKWLATQQGILWVTQGGLAMRRLDDDGSGIESFDVSPDGNRIAWATRGGKVYLSHDGRLPQLVGPGRDPRWHPDRPEIIYAGGRVVGDTTIGYDLRLADLNGAGRFLTATQYSNERWPQWHPNGRQIIYTIAHTTDVYVMEFKP